MASLTVISRFSFAPKSLIWHFGLVFLWLVSSDELVTRSRLVSSDEPVTQSRFSGGELSLATSTYSTPSISGDHFLSSFCHHRRRHHKHIKVTMCVQRWYLVKILKNSRKKQFLLQLLQKLCGEYFSKLVINITMPWNCRRWKYFGQKAAKRCYKFSEEISWNFYSKCST